MRSFKEIWWGMLKRFSKQLIGDCFTFFANFHRLAHYFDNWLDSNNHNTTTEKKELKWAYFLQTVRETLLLVIHWCFIYIFFDCSFLSIFESLFLHLSEKAFQSLFIWSLELRKEVSSFDIYLHRRFTFQLIGTDEQPEVFAALVTTCTFSFGWGYYCGKTLSRVESIGDLEWSLLRLGFFLVSFLPGFLLESGLQQMPIENIPSYCVWFACKFLIFMSCAAGSLVNQLRA